MDNEINLLTIAADIAGKVDIDKVDKDQLKLSEYYMQSDLEELRRITKADSEGFNPNKIITKHCKGSYKIYIHSRILKKG